VVAVGINPTFGRQFNALVSWSFRALKRFNRGAVMAFEVVRYEHPTIIVRNTQTGEMHEFPVKGDGTLADARSRTDLGDARRAAIKYLFDLRRSRDENP
jgi:hypothetical protein